MLSTKKILLSITVICLVNLFPNIVFSQEKYQLAYEKEGDVAMENEDYEYAIEQYQIARRFFKTPPQIYYKIAESHRLLNNYDKAEYWYNKLIAEYEADNITTLFPDLYIKLAKVSMSNGNPFSAQASLKRLLEDCPFIEIRKQAKKELDNINWAIDNNKPEDGVTINNLGKNINNNASQYGTFILGDSILYFSSIDYIEVSDDEEAYYEDTYQQLFYSYIDDYFYTPSKKVEAIGINRPKKNTSNISFNNDFTIAYYTHCNELSDNAICEIYSSYNDNGYWTRGKKLNEKINLKGYNNTHPYLSQVDGKNILYFSSNRPGYGGYDLWYVDLDNNSEPINLGPTINTEGNEITPFYCIKDKSLYFSSDTHKGFGGFDIFKSHGWLSRWTTPENLMQPINSIANDYYPYIQTPDEMGYFSSNREGSFTKENKTCCNDLFSFRIEKINTEPVIEQIKKIKPFTPALDLPLSLFFHNDQPNPQSTSTKTKFDYKECYNEYKGLSNVYRAQYTKGLSDSVENAAIDSINNFFNINIDKGMTKLNDMFSYLLDNLKEGKKINVSVRGFSSSLHNDLYNYSLSERRIETIINYMYKWNNGALIPYLVNKADDETPFLNIKTIAMGKIESKSPNPNSIEEKRKSIYTLDAMFERKIEIRLIEFR
ncbi:MAG: hypothetical protein H6Q15_255 [Bacteroidetes bacterium]|nr:hypothetical protein [Bacteroidota bacterium]